MSGVARSNPSAVPYAPDAYAGQAPPVAAPPTAGPGPGAPDDEEDGTSPVVWIAGIVAILLLAAIAFLVFQLAGGGGATPSAHRRRRRDRRRDRPELRRQHLVDANTAAEALGITLVPDRRAVRSAGRHDPGPGLPVGHVPAGRERGERHGRGGADTVPVPDAAPISPRRRRCRRSSRPASVVGQRDRRASTPTSGQGLGHLAEPAGRHCRGQGHAGRLRRLEGP